MVNENNKQRRGNKVLEVKTYKNWKEICETMGWKTTGGNIKKKNLQVLDSLCKYIKDGNKFIVTNIFDEPKEIIDKRKSKESTLDYSQFKVEKEIEINCFAYVYKIV